MTTAAVAITQRRVYTHNAAVRMTACHAATDLTALSLAALGGFRLWVLVNRTIPLNPPHLWLAVCLSMAAMAFFGLYPGVGLTAVEQIRRVSQSVTLVYLILAASMFIVKDWWANSRGGFLLSWLLSVALVPLGRWVIGRLLTGRSWWGIPVMILGAGETARIVIGNLRATHVLGYRPVVCLDDNPARQGVCCGVPVPAGLSDVSYFAEAYGTPCAVVAMPRLGREQLVERLEHWSKVFPKIVIVPDLFGVASLWTEPRDLGGILGLEIRCNLLNPFNQVIKRVIDIVLAATALLVAAPIIALAAAAIAIKSPGSPFYFQTREGRDGTTLRVWKLRTMHLGAEQMLETYLAADPAAREEWVRCCKLKHDPRVIPGVGGFLRATSLDELPQLWNILRGEMSLVGPRPFPRYHNARFRFEFQRLRTRVTPGLTGLWQVTARSDGDLEAQMALDSYYIRNWSTWLDLYILVRTVRAVLAGKGAY